VRSINGNGDRGNSNGGLEGRFASRRNIVVAAEVSTNVVSVELALVRSSGGVRVRSLSINTVVLDNVLEGLVHETSLASLVSLSSGAINEVLLGEAYKGSSLQEMSTFGGTSGRERPARSALSLVLNLSDGTLGSPVKFNTSITNVMNNRWVGVGPGDVHTASPALELLEGLIGELVKSNGESSSFGVPSVNEVIVVSENGESLLGFEEGLVELTVLVLPVVEGFSVLLFGEGRVGTGNKSDEKDGDHEAELAGLSLPLAPPKVLTS